VRGLGWLLVVTTLASIGTRLWNVWGPSHQGSERSPDIP